MHKTILKDVITLTIDGTEVTTKKGTTVLEAAQAVGIYIPRLCYHPNLPPAPGTKANEEVYRGGELIKSDNLDPVEFEGCQLCVVEIEGMEGFPTACDTPAADGMVVRTDTPRVQELRRDNLASILADHPHACLLCEEREGCDLEQCTLGVPVNERCCDKFGDCELQKVAEYIGIRKDIPRYVFRNLPLEETTLLRRDHNLCIDCARCVRVCRDMRGVGALGFVYRGGEFILGTVGPSLEESECVFCGACAEVCPTGALIDKGPRWPKGEKRPVGICEKFCTAKALNFDQKEETLELDVGAIIACTGFDQMNPTLFEEFSFGLHPNIVTNLQLEQLMQLGIHRPSDGKAPRKVAFILCVGSRMTNEEKGEEYCCKIGCMAAIKQAMLLQKALPDVQPWVFYTDIRADGKGYEEFYVRAQDHKVRFVRGRVAEVVPLDENHVRVRAEETFLGTQIEGTFDLVVLVVGIIPSPGTQELAKKLGIQVGADGFLLERHFKLRPVDSQREGIFVSGCALGPKDIRETTLEAMATASRVATFLGKGEISVSPEVAYIIPEKCNICEVCITVCPVAAVEKSSATISINPISCIGCGICVPRCPEHAIELNHCTDEQLIAQIQGVCEGGKSPKIIAFIERETAYGSADLAGQTRESYPSNVEIIAVPTTGRVSFKHVLHAFAAGADGIIFVEDHGGPFKEDALRKQVTEMKKKLREYGIESLRLISISTTLPEYNKILNIFETLVARLKKMGPISEEKRQKIQEEIATQQKN